MSIPCADSVHGVPEREIAAQEFVQLMSYRVALGIVERAIMPTIRQTNRDPLRTQFLRLHKRDVSIHDISEPFRVIGNEFGCKIDWHFTSRIVTEL